MNKTVSLISLGCAKNLVDSEVLVGGLKHEKYSIITDSNEADIVIINTCGFLDTAREESIEIILESVELKKSGKVKQLIVMGCFSERYSDELVKELPEVDAFFGTSDHAEILSFITGKKYNRENPDYFRSLLTPKHYAYLKIAEGCDNGCSFCSIPIMRGMQKSQSLEWNALEAQRLADNGVKELLIIAQDSTSYGWDLDPKVHLHELMQVLNNTNGIEWIRLHYAHPSHLHREMIKQFNQLDKLVPYIDIPIQHGSDSMLRSMRRGLSVDGIRKRLETLRTICSDIAIRTSVIVGYPGETETDFKQLLDFVEEIQFDRLGVFTYSEEEGTYAANALDDNIPKEVKNERLEAVMLLQQNINLQKNKERIGKIEKVIVDAQIEENWSLARSYRDAPEVDNYVKIPKSLPVGEFVNVKITEAFEYDVIGEEVE